jgi:hypothetical protein
MSVLSGGSTKYRYIEFELKTYFLEDEMKRTIALLILCMSVAMVTNPLLADEFIISTPFAFQERFPGGMEQIGFPEGNFLQVGCFIKPAGASIKEITVRNINTGLVLKASPVNPGDAFSGLYQVFPMPVFDPEKHVGVWEVRVKDQAGDEKTEKTHELEIKGILPFVKGVKASGEPLSPTITWHAPAENALPQGVKIRYQVRLLKAGNQFSHLIPALRRIITMPSPPVSNLTK